MESHARGHTFSGKGQMANVFSSAGRAVSVAVVQLCHRDTKASTIHQGMTVGRLGLTEARQATVCRPSMDSRTQEQKELGFGTLIPGI